MLASCGLELSNKYSGNIDTLALFAQNLAVGTRLWGAVLEATPRQLVISLPHGLRGHVTPAEVTNISSRRTAPSALPWRQKM